MPWAGSSEVASDDCTARYDRLATEDDVLWSCNSGSSGNLVTCILSIFPEDISRGKRTRSYRFNELGLRVVDGCFHAGRVRQ